MTTCRWGTHHLRVESWVFHFLFPHFSSTERRIEWFYSCIPNLSIWIPWIVRRSFPLCQYFIAEIRPSSTERTLIFFIFLATPFFCQILYDCIGYTGEYWVSPQEFSFRSLWLTDTNDLLTLLDANLRNAWLRHTVRVRSARKRCVISIITSNTFLLLINIISIHLSKRLYDASVVKLRFAEYHSLITSELYTVLFVKFIFNKQWHIFPRRVVIQTVHSWHSFFWGLQNKWSHTSNV